MPFHVTVAVGPPGESPPDLGPEVGLVKAALLYGDRVALVSPAANLLRRLLAEDAIESTGYLRALVSRYADRPSLLAPLGAPALSLALAGPDALAHAVGLAIGASSVGANAWRAWHEAEDRRREAEAHRLFFYVAAGRRLAEAPGGR